jgi:hypothetical protein
MESTGVYWKPVFNILEGHLSVLLVNARHINAVPGRKTDVHDCEWLVDLLRHGLVRASFIPGDPRDPGADALSASDRERTHGGGQSDPEGVGEREYQAGAGSE